MNSRKRSNQLIQRIGTGTILDAWKLGVPVIVVPNTRLMNDHQTELAQYLSKEGYATQSTDRYDFSSPFPLAFNSD